MSPPRLLATALLLAASCGSAESRAEALREHLAGSNVLLVAVESMAADHTSPQSYARNTTPALSRLAQEGVRFTDVTAGSPNGFASTCSLFAGEALDLCGADEPGETLPTDAVLLAEAFRRSGYRTLAISTHPAVRAELGLGRGFDEFVSIPRTLGAGVPAEVHERVDRLLTHPGDAPFFAHVQLGTALVPRLPSAETARSLLGYVPDPLAGTAAFLEQSSGAGPAPQRTLAAIDLYDAVLADVDAAIGRWSELLARTERERDTLLVVAGTNGQAFGQRGRFGVGDDVHQESIAVPLFMRLPGARAAGLVVREAVALYDLYPTLADLLQLDAPASRSGAALTPLLSGDWLEREWPVVSRTPGERPQYSLRQGHFKLIARAGRGGGEPACLQHLERDPLETRDWGPQRPETLGELQKELRRFREFAAGAASAPGRVEPAPELAEQLSALGYALGESESTEGGDL